MTGSELPFFEPSAKFASLHADEAERLAIWSGRALTESECRELVLPCLFDIGLQVYPSEALRWGMPRIDNQTMLIEASSIEDDEPYYESHLASVIGDVKVRDMIDDFAASVWTQPIYVLVADPKFICVYEFPRFKYDALEQFAMCGGFVSTWLLVTDQAGTSQMLFNADFQVLAISQAPSRGELRLGGKPVEFWNERFEAILPQEAVGQVHIDRMNELYVPRVKGMKPIGPFRR